MSLYPEHDDIEALMFATIHVGANILGYEAAHVQLMAPDMAVRMLSTFADRVKTSGGFLIVRPDLYAKAGFPEPVVDGEAQWLNGVRVICGEHDMERTVEVVEVAR